MPQRSPSIDHATSSRRQFLKGSTAVAVGGAVASTLALPSSVHAAVDDTIRIALIGCGGRGTGAANNAMNADDNVKVVAMADAFESQLAKSLKILQKRRADRVDVPKDRQFVGFDAYKKVMALKDVDVVLLATSPHFRPAHLKAAVEAGKHIFCEKPVAVDGPGVRSVLETVQKAKEKKLTLVSGLCYRYDLAKREVIKRIHDGAIGDVVAMNANYNTGTLWHRGRQPEWSDMEWQMRNWLYHTWLSGDHIVEQHIHSLDKAAWVMGDAPPKSAFGAGGREVRTDPKFGNIYDHHCVTFEYENGARLFSNCRQIAGAKSNVSDHIYGNKGYAELMSARVNSEAEQWRFRGSKPNMYDREHAEMFASIRSGDAINNGRYMAHSTLMAIMGRMATYTGQLITWDMALNSKEDLTPAEYKWGPLEVAPIAVPGRTKFV